MLSTFTSVSFLPFSLKCRFSSGFHLHHSIENDLFKSSKLLISTYLYSISLQQLNTVDHSLLLDTFSLLDFWVVSLLVTSYITIYSSVSFSWFFLFSLTSQYWSITSSQLFIPFSSLSILIPSLFSLSHMALDAINIQQLTNFFFQTIYLPCAPDSHIQHPNRHLHLDIQ